MVAAAACRTAKTPSLSIRYQRRRLASKRRKARLLNDRYFTNWKIRRPNRLKKVLRQRKGICLAIGVVRHFTALLIKDGRLSEDEELSIEDLIQLIRQFLPVYVCDPNANYGMYNFKDCEGILKNLGIVREKDNPLRYDFENLKLFALDNLPERFTIKAMNTVLRSSFAETRLFENSLIRQLRKSPIACGVNIYSGYQSAGKEVYEPRPGDSFIGMHVMLLVAHGRLKGKQFLEFQDSYGLSAGSKGFVRLALGKDLIREFLIIDV